MEEDDGPRRKPRLSVNRIILFGVLPLLLAVSAGAGVYFSGILDSLFSGAGSHDEAAGPNYYYDLDEMLVSLNGRGRKPSFLKLRVSLELEKATDQARIQAVMPRIIDNFQVFLRELRIEELQGSQGLYRVKEELLARVNAAAYPTKVKDVLFKEMLVQ